MRLCIACGLGGGLAAGLLPSAQPPVRAPEGTARTPVM